MCFPRERSLRSSGLLCRDQILESYHRHLTVQQDGAAPSETHGELDEPETPSQATHTPGEETEGRQGAVTGRRLGVLGAELAETSFLPGQGAFLMQVSQNLSLDPFPHHSW